MSAKPKFTITRKITALPKNLREPVSRMIKREVNRSSETKYNDFDRLTPDAINTTGLTYGLSSIADGVLASERVGEKIRAFNISVKGSVRYNVPTTAVQPVTVRLILYRDMSQGNQNSTITDVLETGLYPTTQQYNWENKQRFQILKDMRVVVDPLATRDAQMKNITMNVSRSMLMSFDGAGAGSGGKGRLFLGVISDEPTIAESPEFNFCSRLKFKDS